MLNIDVIDKIQPMRTRISPKQLLLKQQLQQEDAVSISEEKTLEIEGLLPKLEETYNERRHEKTPNSVAKKRQQAIGGWTSTSFSQTYTEMEADHRGTPINNQKKLSSYSKAVVESKVLRSNNKLQRPTVLLEEKNGTVIEGSLGYIKGSSKDLTSLTKVKTETKIKIKTKQHIQLKPLTKKERDAEMIYMKKVNSYKLFMNRINFSYNILIKQEQPVSACYKFYAENGANSQLIHNIMKQRWWWAPVKDKNAAGINFMWTLSVNTKYIGTLQKQRKQGEEAYYETEINGVSCIDWESNLASMNSVVKAAVDSEQNLVLESQATSNRNSPMLQTGFDEIKLKQPSLKNLSISALDEEKKGKKQKSGTSPMLPTTNMELEDLELLKNLLTKRELGLMRNYYGTRVVKTKKEMNYQDFEEMSKMRSRQTLKYVSDVGKQKVCNHMENNGCLSDQAEFFETMRMYYGGKKEESKNLLRTFYVKGGLEDKEFKAFVECFNQKQKNFGALVMAKGTRNIAKENTNYWIVKPVGIKLKGNSNPIYNDLTSIIRVIHEGKRIEAEFGNGEIVYMIQQYIDRPMLYQKKRMEIKCFILISTLNNHMKGYWYLDGYVSVIDEKPNHMTFDDFKRFLEDNKAYEGMFKSHIYPQFKALCTDIIKSICGKIDPHRRESSFEISEVTLTIDKDLKVWLTEVNPQPEFKDEGKILADFIPTMINNVLRVTIDPIFPVINWNDVNKANLPENMLEANKLELVYDEMEEAFLAKNSMKEKDYTIDEVGKIGVVTNEDLP